jgi:hypothetical protein
MYDQHYITQLRLELDYIERQMYMKKATKEDKQRCREIERELYKLTK